MITFHSENAEDSGDAEKLVLYDSDLGWRNAPNYVGNNETHNSVGFRGGREYSIQIPQGITRIICVGDSFTYGSRCDDADTYPAQLESLDSSIEAINMGAGGYGIDQAYLWYKRDGVAFESDILLFAFIQNDFERMALPTFRTRSPKPLLVVKNQSLKVTNVPVPNFSKSWFSVFPKKTATYLVFKKVYDEAVKPDDVFPIAVHVFDDLHQMSRSRKQHMVLVYLPTMHDDFRQKSKYASRVRELAESRNIPFIDFTDTFKNLSPETLLNQFQPNDPSGHYSPEGNRLVAMTLLKELEELIPEFAQRSSAE